MLDHICIVRVKEIKVKTFKNGQVDKLVYNGWILQIGVLVNFVFFFINFCFFFLK